MSQEEDVAPDVPLVARAAGTVVGLVLAGLALVGTGALLVGVLVAQLLLVPALLVLQAAPGRRGALLVGVGAAVAADLLVLRDDTGVGSLAGVVALALVAAQVHQLVRGDGRPRVAASLPASLLAVVLVVPVACLAALREEPDARAVTVAALLAGAVAVLAPHLVGGRDVPGVLLATVLGAAVAGVVAASLPAVLLGAAVGLAAALPGVALRRWAVPPASARGRVLVATRHGAALLPYAVLAPVALVAGRLVLG